MLFQVVFVLACAAYLVSSSSVPALVGALLKILPILMLLARAARRQRVYLVLGLLASLAGDVILALSPQAGFVAGIAAFLIAHVLYITTFAPDVRYSKRSVGLAACVIAWCAGVGSIVVPSLGGMLAPVVLYMIVIAAMGVTAAFATGARLALFIGAFAFVVSDSVIAFDRFVAHVPHAAAVVMITYYFGQYWIVSGVIERDVQRGAPVGALQ
ncbi:MAG: lysoplasmalogenase [Bacteroidales bacterium]